MQFRHRILSPTAGPVPAKENAEYLVRLVKALRAELIVVHILDPVIPEGSPQEAEGRKALSYFEQAARYHEVPVRTKILRGPVARTIVEEAAREEVQLIVMGVSEGRTVAEWVVSDIREKCKVPVVVAPGGFSDIF